MAYSSLLRILRSILGYFHVAVFFPLSFFPLLSLFPLVLSSSLAPHMFCSLCIFILRFLSKIAFSLRFHIQIHVYTYKMRAIVVCIVVLDALRLFCWCPLCCAQPFNFWAFGVQQNNDQSPIHLISPQCLINSTAGIYLCDVSHYLYSLLNK